MRYSEGYWVFNTHSQPETSCWTCCKIHTKISKEKQRYQVSNFVLCLMVWLFMLIPLCTDFFVHCMLLLYTLCYSCVQLLYAQGILWSLHKVSFTRKSRWSGSLILRIKGATSILQHCCSLGPNHETATAMEGWRIIFCQQWVKRTAISISWD